MTDAVRELLDRERIRALANAYAFAVDARDFERLRELWVPDARLAIYAGDPAPDALRFEARGQEAIVRALRGIERYPVTSHQLGGQEVWLEGDRARAQTRCLASHLFVRAGARWCLEMAIRYQDRLARVGEEWRFVERALAVDWESEGPLPARDRARGGGG
ncbi:MAG TPA: nuclear transport factor 2 family protein [Myxococcota bacterium]|nr:nuclear transport factor 2 family protein [Myxococcota bacterium]